MNGAVFKKTKWQKVRLNSSLEFKDVSTDGSEQNTVQWEREHWIFERYIDLQNVRKIVSMELGDLKTSVELRYAPGGGGPMISLPRAVDANGDEILWICTSDDIVPNPEKTGFERNNQVWEVFTTWVERS